MIDQNTRPSRKVAIADHLWETYEDMALQMGSDREALINQALFMFARLNGFIEVGAGNQAQARAHPPMLAPATLKSPTATRDEGTPLPVPSLRRASEERPAAHGGFDQDPARRDVAERVLETAAELERLIKGKNEQREELSEEDEASDDRGDSSQAAHDSEASHSSASGEGEEEGGQLYLMAEGGELDKILKERFVIGRGKHCDFVINSGKVSREHAVILREGSEYFIEDLGSSNGTWFNKQRIKRRKIEDGDEYFICSEKIKLVVR